MFTRKSDQEVNHPSEASPSLSSGEESYRFSLIADVDARRLSGSTATEGVSVATLDFTGG
jgi:hypothetical protein